MTPTNQTAGACDGAGRRSQGEDGIAQRSALHGNHDTPVLRGRQELFGANGKVCAWVTDDGCLCKQVDGSRHFLRKPAGIAFDAAILREAGEWRAARVWVKDRETGIIYRATLDAFAEHGVKLDRGFGPQVCLPFAFWQTQKPGAPVQLGLF